MILNGCRGVSHHGVFGGIPGGRPPGIALPKRLPRSQPPRGVRGDPGGSPPGIALSKRLPQPQPPRGVRGGPHGRVRSTVERPSAVCGGTRGVVAPGPPVETGAPRVHRRVCGGMPGVVAPGPAPSIWLAGRAGLGLAAIAAEGAPGRVGGDGPIRLAAYLTGPQFYVPADTKIRLSWPNVMSYALARTSLRNGTADDISFVTKPRGKGW